MDEKAKIIYLILTKIGKVIYDAKAYDNLVSELRLMNLEALTTLLDLLTIIRKR